MKKSNREIGFTLIELLVGMSIFSVVSLGVVSYMGDAFKRIHIENKSALHSQELRSALNLIASELRMSSNISPYLPGSDTNLLSCSTLISNTDNTLKFIVTHDDDSGTSGINPTYVGYIYDSDSKELRRGFFEIANHNICTLPLSDPIDDAPTMIIAENVIPVDNNSDGTLDPIFSLNNNILSINMGYESTGAGGIILSQNLSVDILIRANN